MRYNLIVAREATKLTPAKVSDILGISERMYRYIEAGTRNGNYVIWDELEDLFKISQRQLRENSPSEKN